MNWIRKHHVVFFFVSFFLLSWIAWTVGYLLFPGNFLFQLPFMRMGAFAPALMSILFCSLDHTAVVNNRKKRWLTFLSVWMLASVHFYLYLIYIEGVEGGLSSVVITCVTSLLPAFVLSSIFSKKRAIREHLSTIIFPKGKVVWYVIAFLLIPFFLLLDVVTNHIIGNEITRPAYTHADHSVMELIWFFLLILITQSLQAGGLSEEPGWRGFAQKELQKKYSPLVVGLVIGLAWGVWHFPVYIAQISSMSIWMIVLGCIQIGLTFTWIYNRTKGSLLAVIILHASWNTCTQFIPKSYFFDIGMGIFLLLIVLTDKMWVRKTFVHNEIDNQ